MEKEEYDLANLPSATVEQVRSLEKLLSADMGEEVILIAYKNQTDEEKNMDFNS